MVSLVIWDAIAPIMTILLWWHKKAVIVMESETNGAVGLNIYPVCRMVCSTFKICI